MEILYFQVKIQNFLILFSFKQLKFSLSLIAKIKRNPSPKLIQVSILFWYSSSPAVSNISILYWISSIFVVDLYSSCKRENNIDIYNINENEESNENSDKKVTYILIQIDANNSLHNNEPEKSDYVLNNYNYESALKYESRSFWKIFYIIMLSKDHILNTFILKSPMELQPLRICLFASIYSGDLALNTLFYFSENISDKYHYTGNHLFLYTLFNNILISVISTIISFVLVNILKILTTSKRRIKREFEIEEIKLREYEKYYVNDERKIEIQQKIKSMLKLLRIKMIIFIVLDFLILLFFFYFVTNFCEVYLNTQTSWISDSVVSIIIGFPIEVVICIFITIMYKIALKYKCRYLYEIVILLY